MKTMTRTLLPLTFAVAAASSVQAAELDVSVEIPEMTVAEYHNPYVAVWLENKDSKEVINLAVWYDTDMRDDEGKKWLKDMRQWWRRSGRSLEMPVDGVSAATQGPGKYDLSFTAGKAQLKDLADGEYRLRVEAAREVGGREILNIPFSWPADKAQTLTVQGESELGEIALTIKP
ncbi:MAG: hypothetical protein CMI03_12795 [Oceanospirillaceae bacterium]|uniref:DUF2271 domain-containing protein n=1 Tax=unclassified Thalassolituus TaxID=2624967 RepID=UPI000C52967D|nr:MULTISPECIES: DUF2271 domain-containing protein [unclassified Thalassolituus]MAS23796.1 hypothetical protein [Oceanospirillaceae bacterium]MBS53614.1 hypothetical protein [Oceanospirillaceae bacterium]|tara:strand:+ start:3303 stop:3827 length:525 start_codon:yes stop_codon:yes gene_type:complete